MKKKTLVNEVKQFQKIAGILRENEDIQDSGKEHYETAQDFVNHVFEILNDEMRVGSFSERGLDRADMYLEKHKEELAKSGKSAQDVADDLIAKFTTARP